MLGGMKLVAGIFSLHHEASTMTCQSGQAKILATIGSISIARLGFVVRAYVGDKVYLGDVIETGADGAVRIAFNDGTAFNLLADVRMELDEFVCDPSGTANSARFTIAKGSFTFIPGQLGKSAGLMIDTPVACIRGSARGVRFGILSLTTLAFSLLRDVQLAHAASTDDDTITLRIGARLIRGRDKIGYSHSR